MFEPCVNILSTMALRMVVSHQGFANGATKDICPKDALSMTFAIRCTCPTENFESKTPTVTPSSSDS
jgi:hypothetical protein